MKTCVLWIPSLQKAFLIITLVTFLSACTTATPQANPGKNIPPTNTPPARIFPTEHIVSLVTQTPAPLNLAATAQELKSKVQSHFRSSHWIWMQTEYLVNEEREYIPKLPNGMDKPSHYIEETWYHINAEKLVDSYLMTTLSMNRDVLMSEVYKDGFSYSPLVHDPVQLAPWPIGDFDNGLLDRTLQPGSGSQYQVDQEELHGKQVVKISTVEMNPVSEEGLRQKVKGAIMDAYYDAQEGWKIQEDTRYILEDGTEFLAASQIHAIRAGLTPPEAVVQQIEAAGQ